MGEDEARGLAARVAAQLQGIVAPRERLTVGLSGGVDSVVLLDCLKTVSRKLRFRLAAVHVDHQLSPNASRWSAFCRRLCRAHGVPFESVTVNVHRGGGPEAAARMARYAVFASRDCDYIVLAHHRDDQVETLLLQLLRGAGVKGLAGMPFLRDEGGRRRAEEKSRQRKSSSPIPHPSSVKILRPLLDATREEILEYARQRKLKWMEDESNRDARFRRNFLRHEVLPVIARRFPAYRATIARSAGHLSEAAALMDEVAATDARRYIHAGTLRVDGLRHLPAARGRNLLRWFLASHGVAMPATERLGEALRQLVEAKQDARVLIELDGADLRRYEGSAHVVRASRASSPYHRRWQGEKRLELPDGVLALGRATGAGISLARLRTGIVMVGSRRGGERLQPDCRRPGRSLKNLLQEARMAPWLRERLPLLFHDGKLVWAAGIGVDCAYQARRGEAALLPNWLPSA
jgi:tRNA(Ile)-lysidine synthase